MSSRVDNELKLKLVSLFQHSIICVGILLSNDFNLDDNRLDCQHLALSSVFSFLFCIHLAKRDLNKLQMVPNSLAIAVANPHVTTHTRVLHSLLWLPTTQRIIVLKLLHSNQLSYGSYLLTINASKCRTESVGIVTQSMPYALPCTEVMLGSQAFLVADLRHD